MAAITNAIWLAEDKVIKDFNSVCHRQIELVMTIPHNEGRINGQAMVLVLGSRITEIRIIPQPPSFSKIAAKTIDPTTGASTCALGSHEWTPYSGILMRNAIILASHKILDHVWLNEVKLRGGEESLMFLLSFE